MARPVGASDIWGRHLVTMGDSRPAGQIRDTLYRIHCTRQPDRIWQVSLSGCIGFADVDMLDLYVRGPVDARVQVI